MSDLTENLPVAQHYVPAWLLRKFVDSGNHQLWASDLRNRKHYRLKAEDAAKVRNFYTLEQKYTEKKELYQVEIQGNGFFDDKGSDLVANIIKENRLPKGKDDFETLLAVIAWQKVRTPIHRENINQVVNDVGVEFIKNITTDEEQFVRAKESLLRSGEEEREFLDSFSFDDFRRNVQDARLNIPRNFQIDSMMKGAVVLNQLFLGRSWRLIFSEKNDEFVVSDNPVVTVVKNSDDSPAFSSPGAMVVMPVSPHHLIVGVSDERFGLRDLDKLKKDQVANINRAMIMNAHRFVFRRRKDVLWLNDKGIAETSTQFTEFWQECLDKALAAGETHHAILRLRI